MTQVITNESQIQSLFEDLPPMQSKRVAVIIGRFNPPQVGHYKLISDVVSWIKNNPKLKLEALPIVVVIGGSKSDSDLKRNPLSVQDRIMFMQSSGKCNGIKFLSAPNAFKALEEVRKAGYEPIAVAAGSDRIDGYITILDKYYTDSDEETIKHYKIELSRADSAVETDKDKKHDNMVDIINKMRDGQDPSVDEISASLARVAVELDAKKEFAKIVGLEKNDTLANKMFAKIKAAMES
jgi:hypothetical protein